MQFQSRVKVIGVLSNKGQMDNGTQYDYTRLLVLNELSGEGKKGFAQSEYNYGKSTNYAKFEGVTFPFDADVICDVTSTGKVQKIEVTDFKPAVAMAAPKKD